MRVCTWLSTWGASEQAQEEGMKWDLERLRLFHEVPCPFSPAVWFRVEGFCVR